MAEQDEWIDHRELGVGKVEERDGKVLGVRFKDRFDYVDSKYRWVAADSLEVQAFSDDSGLLGRLTSGPVEVARLILRDATQPLSESQMRRALVRLGIEEHAVQTWWGAVSARLDLDPQFTRPDPDQPRWALAAEPEAPNVLQHLVVLADPAAHPGTRQAARAEIEAAWGEGRLAPGEAAAARRLGAKVAADGPIPADLDPRVLRALVDKARDDDAPFLIDVVMRAPTDVSRMATNRLRELVTGARLPAIVSEVLEAVRPEVAATFQPGEPRNALVQGLKRLHAVVAESASPRLAKVLLGIESDAAGGSAKPGPVERAASNLLAASGPDQAVFAKAIEHLDPAVSVGRLRSLRLAPDSARLAYLSALASRGAVAEPANWVGVDLAALASVADAPLVTGLLETPAGRRLLASVVKADLIPLRLPGLALLAGHPKLLAVVDPGELERQLDALTRQVPALEPLRSAWGSKLREEAAAAASARIEEAERQAQGLVEHARAAVVAAEESVASANQRADHAEERLRRAVTSQAVPLEAELRQARIDGMRVAGELLAELGRAGEPGSSTLAHLTEMAAARGLVRLGRPHDVVSFDATRHRMLDGDPTREVCIVEPGWAIRDADAETVLIHAVVRRTDAADGGAEG